MSVIFGIKENNRIIIAGDKRGSSIDGKTLSDDLDKVLMINDHLAFSSAGNAAIEKATVIVAPITSRIHTKAKLPTHTLINDFEGLDKNSIILFEQIRTIDKQRLRKYVGMLYHLFFLLYVES